MARVFEVLAKDHAEVKQLLAELEAGPTASSGATSDDLSMRKKLPDGDTLADAAIGQEQAGKEVLDKPHPHSPPSPGALKSAGPPAARADRVRDKATWRGE